MPVVSKVLVIGGGIGGLAAARALRLKGISVDLIEKEPRWTVYGVGIIQPNNFLRAMARIGLAQACLDRGGAFGGWRILDEPGAVLIDAAPDISIQGYPANNGITRPVLHDILIKGATEAGARIRLGTTATSMDDDGKSVAVTFSDGSQNRYDLVIAFDGVFSDTRKQLFGDTFAPHFTGQGAWRYNLPRPAELDTGAIVLGSHSKAGLVPLSPTLMYIFLLSSEREGSWYRGPDLADQLRARLAGYGGLVARLREQIVDADAVVYRPLLSVLVDPPWGRGRILLAGDAAHSTTPHLAQGAAMAVEDAVLLGEVLGREGPVEAALAEFMARRFERVKYVVDTSTTIAGWELDAWRDQPDPHARQGELLHEASIKLLEDF